MLLSVITDAKSIKKCHDTFAAIMKSNGNQSKKEISISTPGGTFSSKVYSEQEETGIWWGNGENVNKNKFYNRFGKDYDSNKNNSIIVQANYQINFTDYAEACLWAEDNAGNVFLLHSGKMGGGVEGITIENVANRYKGDKATIIYGKSNKTYYIVCKLNSPIAYEQTLSFVKQIGEIKAILKELRGSEIKYSENLPLNLKSYFPEFWGKRTYTFPETEIIVTANHGYVVDCLKGKLEHLGDIVKNIFIDLGLAKRGKPNSIFEIKTSINRQAIYTSIGQLMLHSASTASKPAKYLVIPDGIDPYLKEDIEDLGIKIIEYIWKGKTPHFTNLGDYFNI